jgi:hypothetical protein
LLAIFKFSGEVLRQPSKIALHFKIRNRPESVSEDSQHESARNRSAEFLAACQAVLVKAPAGSDAVDLLRRVAPIIPEIPARVSGVAKT